MEISILSIYFSILISGIGLWSRYHGFTHGEFRERWENVHSAFSLYFFETFMLKYGELGNTIEGVLGLNDETNDDKRGETSGEYITKLRKNLSFIKDSLNEMLVYSSIEEFLQLRNGFAEFSKRYTRLLLYFLLMMGLVLAIILLIDYKNALGSDAISFFGGLIFYGIVFLLLNIYRTAKILKEIYDAINGIFYELETDNMSLGETEHLQKLGEISQKI